MESIPPSMDSIWIIPGMVKYSGARKWYTIALGGLITAPPDEDEFSSNAASSFYATMANTNMNVNIKESYTDSSAPAPLLKRVGTPQSFSHVIGGSFSSSPMGDDDDDKKKGEEGEGEFGEGEETIGKSSGLKLQNVNGSVSSTSKNSKSPGGPQGGDYKSMATTSPSALHSSDQGTERIWVRQPPPSTDSDAYHGD